MSESARLPRRKREALIDLGWARPNARKAKRPRPIPRKRIVDVEDLIDGGSIPTVDVERCA